MIRPAVAFTTFNQIKASGQLRVGQLTPHSVTYDEDLGLLRALARHLQAQLLVRPYRSGDALLRALQRGQIDLVGETLAVSRALPHGLSYSLPVRHGDLWWVSSPFIHPQGLSQQPLAVQFASDGWYHALALRQAQALQLQVISPDWSRQHLLQQVARGELASSLAYAHELDPDRYPNLRLRRRLQQDVAMAWVARTQDRVLQAHVNDFLRQQGLTDGLTYVDRDDWPAIRARGRIRLVTLYRPETYFLWNGQVFGFDYELVAEFARHHGLRLDVILARDRHDLEQRLIGGEADIGAAFLTAGALSSKLLPSLPYFAKQGRVIGPAGSKQQWLTKGFDHSAMAVAADSPYLAQLRQWQATGVELRIQMADPGVGEHDLISAVLQGQAELAVVDDYHFRLGDLHRHSLDSQSVPGDMTPTVWAIRRDNPQLWALVNDYWRHAQRRLHYRVIEQKYFAGQRDQSYDQARAAFHRQRAFSPYDDVVRRYAAYYQFDWRLILALIAQESRFDPEAVSSTGARGLMQLQRAASQQVGIDELFTPQANVHAGVRYLDWIRSQLEPDLNVRDRTWFCLAAYNGGLSRVKAARSLARQMGLDHRRWFGQVELAMGALADPARAGAHYSAFDATQVVDYVASIRRQFETYVLLTEERNERDLAHNGKGMPVAIQRSATAASPLWMAR